MAGTFEGYQIPDIGSLKLCVEAFNRQGMSWCGGARCASAVCTDCILCANHGDAAAKIAAFAKYASHHGHTIHRADVPYEDGDIACECEACGKMFTTTHPHVLCEDCRQKVLDGDLHRCDDCGVYTTYIHDMEDSDYHVCGECAEYFHLCSDCGRLFRYASSITDVGDDFLCDTCFSERGYRFCSDCDEICHADDMYDYDGRLLCESCYDTRTPNTIHDYGYKPHPDFKATPEDGDTPIYLGFELEAGDADEDDCNDAAEYIDSETALCYLKHDGSIPDYGFEMVTHPLTFLYHKHHAPWKDILREMQRYGLRSHDASSSCGLHVHVNRDALPPTKWIMVDWFIHREQSKWEQIARRSDEHWCKFKSPIAGASIKDVYGKGMDRYSAINFCNRKTVEFRLFRGSLRYETVIGTLALVDGVVNWAKDVKAHDVLTSGVWQSFVKYLKQHDKYADAIAYINYIEDKED